MHRIREGLPPSCAFERIAELIVGVPVHQVVKLCIEVPVVKPIPHLASLFLSEFGCEVIKLVLMSDCRNVLLTKLSTCMPFKRKSSKLWRWFLSNVVERLPVPHVVE